MRTIKSGSHYYSLDDQGQISSPGWSASGQWRVIGAVEINNFGYNVRQYSLKEILQSPESIPWKWKNGKQRVHIIDLDHGTIRTWMSPTHSVS